MIVRSGSMHEPRRVTARSQRYALFTSGVFVVAALLLGDPFIHKGGHDRTGLMIASGVIEVVMVIVIVRAWRGSTVIADTNGVIARSIPRTRRWRWNEVREFAAVIRPIGAMGYKRTTLAIVLADGRKHWCTDINCRPARDDQTTWIDEVVPKLNACRPDASSLQAAGT